MQMASGVMWPAAGALKDDQSSPPILPLYDPNQLVNHLRENLPNLKAISEEDFTKPSCDRLYPVYRALVQNALSIPDASLDQLPFEAQAGESDPELFRDACPKLILYKLMNSFINDITAHQIEFMLSDILTPQPKKTIQIVSVLVDFWEHVKFREERTNQIFRKFDERAERRELLLNKLTELKGKSEKKRSEKKGKDHLTSQKREQLQQLTEEMTKLKVDSGKHQREIEALESNLRSEAAATKELSDQMTHLKAEDSHLSQKIVTSPDRLQQEIVDLKKTKATAMQQTQELRAQLAEMATREEELATVDHHLESMMTELNSIAAAKAKLVEKQNQLEALVSRREEVNAHLQNEKKKVAQLRLDLQTKEDMLDRAARQHHAKLADINRQRDQYRLKLEQLRAQIGQNEVVQEDLLQQIRKEKDALAAVTRQFECDSKRLDENFSDFKNKHEEMSRRLNEMLAEGLADMQELMTVVNGENETDNDEVGVPDDPISFSKDESSDCSDSSGRMSC